MIKDLGKYVFQGMSSANTFAETLGVRFSARKRALTDGVEAVCKSYFPFGENNDYIKSQALEACDCMHKLFFLQGKELMHTVTGF